MLHLFRRSPKAFSASAISTSRRLDAPQLPFSSGVDRMSSTVPELRARFWGVRGSHPAAQASGSRVGGNTACLEVRYGNQVVMVDAGSGCIAFGEALAREWRSLPPGARPALTVLLTHAHHDHLCGLPFFAPLYLPEAEIHLFGPDLAGIDFGEIVSGYMRSPYFPVDFRDLPSRRSLHAVGDGSRLVWQSDDAPRVGAMHEAPVLDALTVDVLHSTLHPRDGTLLYRFSANGRSLVFATDVEVGAHDGVDEQRFIRFARGADVLVHDAQYSEEDYAGATPHRGYGHSTAQMAAGIARDAGVGRLLLFHHDPAYADAEVLAQQDAARAVFPRTLAAREGLEILMDGGEYPGL
jgi:ribonuclease BN (tRNA processing enzyme)